MPLSRFLLLGAGLAGMCWLAPAQAQGEVYKWVDDAGQVHYSEKKDVAGKQVQALKISTSLPLPADAAPVAGAATAPAISATPAGRMTSLGGATLVYRQAPKLRGAIASAR